jgi:hypothetical protein
VEQQIIAAARALCGADVAAATPVRGGGNNRVFKVDSNAGPFALKVYPLQAEDPRDRLGAEFNGLTFLASHGVSEVPKAIACDRDAGMGLYEWIEGEPIPSPHAGDIDDAVDFAQKLETLSRDTSADQLSLASEACLSGAGIVAQIERRLDRLREAGESSDLTDFLENEFQPFFEKEKEVARDGYHQAGWDFEDDIAQKQRTLSPSDFGFHNTLRRPDGTVVFVDFEYFGWDDPVRLVADFILHPGMGLDKTAITQFTKRALAVFGTDADFRRRLDLLYPLVGLRWCMILLNEFIPERWQRRAFADTTQDRADAQATQLKKARRLLDRLQDPNERFYGGN